MIVEYGTNGSSPRVRGTRCRHSDDAGAIRFIPARAGNTCRPTCATSGATVHPRARGEHGIAYRGQPGNRFIPARAGNTRQLHKRCRFIRFIPARAGNTPSIRAVRRNPRFIPARAGNTRRGRTWTKVLPRFIPARAGNTKACRPSAAVAVHPRACGEHTSGVTTRMFAAVHPRACGEHRRIGHAGGANHGSSPRVRGTRHHQTGRHLQGGSSPRVRGTLARDGAAPH